MELWLYGDADTIYFLTAGARSYWSTGALLLVEISSLSMFVKSPPSDDSYLEEQEDEKPSTVTWPNKSSVCIEHNCKL